MHRRSFRNSAAAPSSSVAMLPAVDCFAVASITAAGRPAADFSADKPSEA